MLFFLRVQFFERLKGVFILQNDFFYFKKAFESSERVYSFHMMEKECRGTLEVLRRKIQITQLVLIISTTVLMAFGGAVINIGLNDRALSKELQSTSALVNRLFYFTRDFSQTELCAYMDCVVGELSEVDVISIVDVNNNRIYHTNRHLVNTQYDGTLPDFSCHTRGFYTENDIGPSGPQRRTYSAFYDEHGNYSGFIMAIRLKKSMMSVTERTVGLFVIVTLSAILMELAICSWIFKNIKERLVEFAEDFEGTKFLVDSMRANSHDFTNKLHVILGLVQIGDYDRAVSYIENISLIQRETVGRVMKCIENPSFAALLIGKIARASECNVKFVLQEGLCFRESDIEIPGAALVTITGNLIDNAIDAMNFFSPDGGEGSNVLVFGVFTKPGRFLMTVKDSGPGISEENLAKVFEKGFSTKGEGRGVGLFHTRQLVESLGGSISVESQAGSGACFMVSFEGRVKKQGESR